MYICITTCNTKFYFVSNIVCNIFVQQVCEEQRCQEDVFPLAVSYLDRFLSTTKVHTRHLQMLGSTCLLLSSKLRESDSLTITVLVSYTDNSVAPGNIMVSLLLTLFCYYNKIIILNKKKIYK